MKKQQFNLNFTRVDIQKTMKEIVDVVKMQFSLKQNKIALKIDKTVPPTVKVDSNRF